MLEITRASRFKKDFKLAKKRGKNLDKLTIIISKLANELPLEEKYKNHRVYGEYKDCWECHVEPDWLLIYKKKL